MDDLPIETMLIFHSLKLVYQRLTSNYAEGSSSDLDLADDSFPKISQLGNRKIGDRWSKSKVSEVSGLPPTEFS